MSLILRFKMEKMNIPDQQDTSSNPTASTTTLEVQVDPVEKITGVVEQENQRDVVPPQHS